MAILVEEEGVQLEHGNQIRADVPELCDLFGNFYRVSNLILLLLKSQPFFGKGIRQPLLKQVFEGDDALIPHPEIIRATARVFL